MKKFFAIFAILLSVSILDAKRAKHPLIEIGPKGSLYISSVRFGIGVEVVCNPLRAVGFRTELIEVSFGDYTEFYMNAGGSLDALIYIPMRGIEPYIHTGFGFSVISNGGTNTTFSIRAGMGLNYAFNKQTILFVEPGIIILDSGAGGGTDAIFRLSFGGRFGLLR